jgi:hypothetical protein
MRRSFGGKRGFRIDANVFNKTEQVSQCLKARATVSVADKSGRGALKTVWVVRRIAAEESRGFVAVDVVVATE